MSRTCIYTGKKTSTGRNVSHSHRRTLRTFFPNLFKKNVRDPQTGKVYNLKLSARAIKTMNKKGVLVFLRELRKKKKVL